VIKTLIGAFEAVILFLCGMRIDGVLGDMALACSALTVLSILVLAAAAMSEL
jgi:hypothetical protein